MCDSCNKYLKFMSPSPKIEGFANPSPEIEGFGRNPLTFLTPPLKKDLFLRLKSRFYWIDIILRNLNLDFRNFNTI